MNLLTDNTIALWITKLEIWPVIAALALNLTFRRYGKKAFKKRMASLYHAIAVFLLTSMAALTAERKWPDIYLVIFILAEIAVLWILRSRVFPYRRNCSGDGCGEKLDLRTIYYMDDNLCPQCAARLNREENEEAEE